MPRRDNVVQRLMDAIDDSSLAPGGCWIWTGARVSSGYGSLSWRGRTVGAHRVAWELSSGPIPDGMCVLHRCDNPPCVNPSHLWLGSVQQNTDDMLAKGRGRKARGSGHGRTALTEADILDMRELHAAGFSYADLGRRYGITKEAARYACLGHTWRHVP